jgi:SAM-dependent methyltransferase
MIGEGVAPEARGPTTSKYANLHFVDGVAEQYDATYAPSTYDSVIWSWQRPLLRRIFRSLREHGGRLKHLDFACGTGRILADVEDLSTESVGLDISPLMLASAERRVRSSLKSGDILHDTSIVDRNYDVITAFRFFLGAEPDIRLAVMRDLAARLRDGSSRLIFNVHGNSGSVLALTSRYRRLRGWPPLDLLSSSEIRRIVAAAGLEVERTRGFGILPRRLYRSPIAPVVRFVDRLMSELGPLTRASQDILYICKPARSGIARP